MPVPVTATSTSLSCFLKMSRLLHTYREVFKMRTLLLIIAVRTPIVNTRMPDCLQVFAEGDCAVQRAVHAN